MTTGAASESATDGSNPALTSCWRTACGGASTVVMVRFVRRLGRQGEHVDVVLGR